MNAEQFYDFCTRHRACSDGLEAIEGLSLREWWNSTDRADWMIWLMEQTGQFDKLMYVRLAIHPAESVSHLVRDEDRDVCARATQTGRDYLANPTEENRKKAAAAAYAVYATTTASYATTTASYAAASASAAAARAAAASAGSASDAAAAYAAARAARRHADKAVSKPNADYVRSLVSYEDILQAITAQTGEEE